MPNGMREVDVDTAAAEHAGGAFVLDVREPYEQRRGHVPDAHLVPLNRLPAEAAELPRDTAIYVICEHGVRSLAAADALARAGFDAYSVAGGMAAWTGRGHPTVTGDSTG